MFNDCSITLSFCATVQGGLESTIFESFDGLFCPSEFDEWLKKFDWFYDLYDFVDQDFVRMVGMTLTADAWLWWKNLEEKYSQKGKTIYHWYELREELVKEFSERYDEDCDCEKCSQEFSIINNMPYKRYVKIFDTLFEPQPDWLRNTFGVDKSVDKFDDIFVKEDGVVSKEDAYVFLHDLNVVHEFTRSFVEYGCTPYLGRLDSLNKIPKNSHSIINSNLCLCLSKDKATRKLFFPTLQELDKIKLWLFLMLCLSYGSFNSKGLIHGTVVIFISTHFICVQRIWMISWL